MDSISKLVILEFFLEVSSSMIRLQPSRLEKNSRADHLPPVLVLPAYYEDTRICPVYYLKGYLKRTKSIRTSDSLFVTVNGPHKAASKSTIRRYIVDARECNVFSSAGSTRSAVTSRARALGAPMSTILEAGDWAGAGVFKKHYYNAVPLNFLKTVFS